MSDQHMHYVSTHAEARAMIDAAPRVWVATCGCRAGREEGQCARSVVDVCLNFGSEPPTFGSTEGLAGLRELTREEANEFLAMVVEQGLVARPFRDPDTLTETVGVCYCCDDCCWYFLGEDLPACGKGQSVEKTDMDACTDCGACIDVCYFGARAMDGDSLAMGQERCFGCGLCVDVCPADAITMVGR